MGPEASCQCLPLGAVGAGQGLTGHDAQADFVVTPENRWVVLEANTGPQTGWLEPATGVPITETMATLLAKGTT
jgi:hypothetical protein